MREREAGERGRETLHQQAKHFIRNQLMLKNDWNKWPVKDLNDFETGSQKYRLES